MTAKAPNPAPAKKTENQSTQEEVQWAGQANPHQPLWEPQKAKRTNSPNQGGIHLMLEHNTGLKSVLNTTKNSPGGFSCYFLDFGHSAPLHHSTSCPKALRCAPALPSKAPRLHHHAELCRGLRSAHRPCQSICRSRKRAKTP